MQATMMTNKLMRVIGTGHKSDMRNAPKNGERKNLKHALRSNCTLPPKAFFALAYSSVRLFGTANAQVEDKYKSNVRLAWIRGAIILHAGGRGGGQIGCCR